MKINSDPVAPAKSAARLRQGLAIILKYLPSVALFSVALVACADFAERPELKPERWAPASAQREWAPSSAFPAVSSLPAEPANSASQPTFRGKQYGLADLVELALKDNPDTRRRWEQARAAAAKWGIAEAAYYPKLSTVSSSGYERIAALVPKHWGVLKNWQSRNLLALNYTLLDFGRREAASSAARDELVAANFLFDRDLQRVVFEVESAFYTLDAAQAAVAAATAVVTAAQQDRRAAQRRRQLGLATQPQLLLAVQREAQAQYDLEAARLTVSDAQARMAMALGVNADDAPDVQPLDNRPIPQTLGSDVEGLIKLALQQRPDLAAQRAAAQEAADKLKMARADLLPTVGASAYYGAYAFNYNLSTGPTPIFTAGVPEYAAMLTLKWDLFTGFSRLNSVKQAESERQAADAQVRRMEVDAAAEVWRSFFTFRTALKKYHYSVALLSASQSSYQSNLSSYRHGLASVLDLVAAERDLAAAQFAIIQSKAEVLISAAAVSYAVGAVGQQKLP